MDYENPGIDRLTLGKVLLISTMIACFWSAAFYAATEISLRMYFSR